MRLFKLRDTLHTVPLNKRRTGEFSWREARTFNHELMLHTGVPSGLHSDSFGPDDRSLTYAVLAADGTMIALLAMECLRVHGLTSERDET